MVAAVLFIALVVTLVLNMPVGIAIGVSSLCAILADGRISSLYIVQQLVTSADSFPLMAIPLFILAGELMGAGGVSKRLLNVCNVFLGRFTGGLATVTVVLCMFFAAVSGSGPATVAAIGSMVIPTMLDKGYSKSFTLALIATAGSIGVIIPPSIPMVIYGVSTSTSISSLFMAGFLPGILIGFSLIVVSYLYCKNQPFPRKRRVSGTCKRENRGTERKTCSNLGCKMGIIKSNYHSWWNLCRNFHTDRGSSCCSSICIYLRSLYLQRV